MKSCTRVCAVVLASGLASSALAVMPVTLLLQEGDAVDGSTVATVNAPFMSGNGTVATLGILEDGRRFVWVDNALDWTSDLSPVAISGAESTLGVADDGSWAISPSLPASNGSSGSDDSWFHSSNQVLLREFDPAPGVPGQIVGFASRVSMDDEGSSYAVSGYRLPDDLSGSDARVFYRTTNPSSGTPTFDVIYESFEVIDGFTVGNGGVDFTYDVSGNGDSLITEIVFNDTPSTADDNMIYHIDLNTGVKTRLAREGDATGDGDNFDNWDGVHVNNAGDYLIHGDTDGDTATDEFMLFNGNIVYREGDAVGGVSMDVIDAADINDHGELVAVFDTAAGGGIESLVYGSDAGDVSTWEILLTVGDELDFDNNGVADGVLADFNISGTINPFEIGNTDTVWLEIDYTDLSGAEIEAIISVNIPAPGAAALLAIGAGALTRRRTR